jgi:hypothetical protein
MLLKGSDMNPEKKLIKLREGFRTLEEEQKDYILGVAGALAFAASSRENAGPGLKSSKGHQDTGFLSSPRLSIMNNAFDNLTDGGAGPV